MQFALTDLGFLGLVHTDNQGTWSLLDEGADFLKPLDEEDAPRAERDWSRKTGIKLTRAEGKLERILIARKQAEHKKRFGKKKSPPPPTQTSRPADRSRGHFRSSGAPPRTAEEEESLEGVKALTAFFEEEVAAFEKELAATSSRAEEIGRIVASLEPREREILRLRFGLDRGEPRSLEEIGEDFGMPREEIRGIEFRAMSKLRPLSLDSPRTLIAAFEGTCVICAEPINIGDAIAIQYQRAKPTGFWFRFHISSHEAPPAVEGWRHDRCPRSGPGGARVPARVPPPGNPPKESAVRRRLFPAEDDD
jgi:RNA polymerase sigma factor (sigma-70 family)